MLHSRLLKMSWQLIVEIIIAGLLLVLLLRPEVRPVFVDGLKKLVQNSTSKRFIVLMIATWFVYRQIPIDGNWLVLAGAYIGLDTINKAGVFGALADKIKSNETNANKE